MRLRSSRWSASVLALGMSAATAVAQSPAAPATDAAYPAQALNYSFDEGGNFYDELDLSSQFRFQADWVSYSRQNKANNIPLFTGPESVSQRDADFGNQSGYRLNLGFMNLQPGEFLKFTLFVSETAGLEQFVQRHVDERSRVRRRGRIRSRQSRRSSDDRSGGQLPRNDYAVFTDQCRSESFRCRTRQRNE